MASNEGRDIYIERVTSKGSSISRHRVWDTDLFVNSLRQEGQKAEEKFTVRLSTEAEFKQQHTK